MLKILAGDVCPLSVILNFVQDDKRRMCVILKQVQDAHSSIRVEGRLKRIAHGYESEFRILIPTVTLNLVQVLSCSTHRAKMHKWILNQGVQGTNEFMITKRRTPPLKRPWNRTAAPGDRRPCPNSPCCARCLACRRTGGETCRRSCRPGQWSDCCRPHRPRCGRWIQ